ncbi:MAG: 30S ribosomal protein S4 [Candidatus Nealsonbacteria bacterium]|nr:30S ribosomal protein S4 [Candidatus Nealsonbacteria bacterium]
MTTLAKCKIVRRLGVNIFTKCEKVFAKKPYPPGQKRKRRRGGGISEFGKELLEKQKLRVLYGLRERQFGKYVEEILEKKGKVEDAPTLLIQKLENRLDNTVFRLGFATTRAQAKQLVSHGFVLVRGKPIDVPSYQVKTGDVVSIKPHKIGKAIFKDIGIKLKKYQPPSWLELDRDKLEGKVSGSPVFSEVAPPVEISSIFEYYSR